MSGGRNGTHRLRPPGGSGRLLLWSAAALITCGAHVAAAVLVLRAPPPAPMPDGPPPAIMIALAPLPEAVNAAQSEAGTAEQNVEQAEPEPPPAPEPEPEPPEVAEEPPPEPDAVPEEIADEVIDLPDAQVAIPTARPRARPERQHVPHERRQKTPPKATQQPEQQPRTAETRAAAKTTPSTRNAAPASSAGRGATNMSPQRWQSKLMAHLERHKRYPRAARSRREQGTVRVQFHIDGRGNVTAVSLAGSSGHAELDRAVLDLVRRASPVPAPPPGANRSIVAPIRFSIR